MVGAIDLTGPGWVLVCSDGLWNYASEPAALQEQIAAAGTTVPAELALKLVDFANGCGGVDNITAALARVDLGQNATETPAATDAAPAAPPAGAPPASPAPPVATAPTAPTAAEEGDPTDG